MARTPQTQPQTYIEDEKSPPESQKEDKKEEE